MSEQAVSMKQQAINTSASVSLFYQKKDRKGNSRLSIHPLPHIFQAKEQGVKSSSRRGGM